GFHSVELRSSDSNVVSNNTCHMNVREVIDIFDSTNNTIEGNICEGASNYFTIDVDRALHKLYHNTLTGNGVRINFGAADVDAIGNTVNGKPIVFLTNENSVEFSGDAGQVILLQCSHVTVRDQVIADVGHGIQLMYCENITLKDSVIANNTWNGIGVSVSPSTTIQNITCYGNGDWGIRVSDSPNCIIKDNICFNNLDGGIYLFDSDYSLVQDNICYSNDGYGIVLYATFDITVVNNNCTDSFTGIWIYRHGNHNISYNLLPDNDIGISLDETDGNLIYMNNLSNYATEGILLDDSQMNTISNNTCTGNLGDVGVYVWVGSSDNIFTNNSVLENNIGLHIEDDCLNNIVYWNQFIDNALYQVGDDGNDSAIHNNYYSDYIGTDSNADGIGDTPYPINGTAGNEDPYPLMSPGFSPVVNYWTTPPTDQTVEYGLGFDYQVDLAGQTIIAATISDTTHFSIDLTLTIRNKTNLAVGIYALTVKARNIHGHYLVGEFTLNVSDTTAPTWIDFPPDQVVEYNELFSYQVTATDISGIDHWELIVDEGFWIWYGEINQTKWLPVGEYQLEVRVYDIYDNYASGVFNLSIVDTTLPVIDNYGDDRYFHAGMLEELEMQIIEDNLVSYVILMDGVEVASGNQTDVFNQIHYSLAHLDVGVYNFTLVVTDVGGNVVSSTIIVTVAPMPVSTSTSTTPYTTPTTPPQIFDPLIFVYLAVVSVAVIAIIVIIMKRRK
ncbi:MAG: right-handed parallel beta-helix repeat-containing protein, partial [Candidatus Thorarchaeota archaeon]